MKSIDTSETFICVIVQINLHIYDYQLKTNPGVSNLMILLNTGKY